jgi:hypothetical protein
MFLDEAQPTAPTIDDPRRKIALDAAALLDRRGWVQHVAESSRGICIQSAINIATAKEGNGARDGLSVALARHVRKAHIYQWNDTPGRTKEEVVGLLRAYGNGEIK